MNPITKDDLIRKLTSRKFWFAVAGFITSLVLFCGGDAGTAQKIAGLITSTATVVAYILGESMTDAAPRYETNYYTGDFEGYTGLGDGYDKGIQ